MVVRVEEDCSGTAHPAPPASETQVGPGEPPWGASLAREWLVTDGRGGYASGTVAGVNTRRYHGLLVAPLAPPLGRTVLLARLEERLTSGEQTVALSSNEFEDGTVHPQGYRHLERFSLEGGVPTWRYRAGGALLQKQIWMPPGRSATCVRYTLAEDAPGPATLAVLPLCTYRDFHQETEGNPDWRLGVRRHGAGLTVQAFAGATPYHLLVSPPPGRAWSYDTSGGQPGWWWRFLHRGERERGLECVEDLYGVGTVVCELAPGESLQLTATIEGPRGRGGRFFLRSSVRSSGSSARRRGRRPEPPGRTRRGTSFWRSSGGPRDSSSLPARSRIAQTSRGRRR